MEIRDARLFEDLQKAFRVRKILTKAAEQLVLAEDVVVTKRVPEDNVRVVHDAMAA